MHLHKLTRRSDLVEVEWKWLLLPDPADFRLPKASPNAIPMPTSRKAQKELNAKRPVDDVPRKDDEFAAGFTWAEFHTRDAVVNSAQVKLDLAKENQIWHYLGATSTEGKAHYTEDPSRPQHNTLSNFLDTIPKPPKPAPVPLPRKQPIPRDPSLLPVPAKVTPVPLPGIVTMKQERPYVYKPRKPAEPHLGGAVQFTSQKFAPVVSGGAAGFPRLPPQPQQHQPPQHVQQRFQPFQAPPFPSYPGEWPAKQPPQQLVPQVQQQRAPSTDHQPKKPPLPNSSDRFAPVGGSNGFPQLPGLSWPPAHMKSGQYSQPQSRVWSTPTDAVASPGPRVPMTSSVIKSPYGHPQAGPTGQPQVYAYQKYTFFQVHHNR